MHLACQKKNTLFLETDKVEILDGSIHKIILTDIIDTNEIKNFIINDKIIGSNHYYYFFPSNFTKTMLIQAKSDKDLLSYICRFPVTPFEAYSISEDGKKIESCKCEDVMSKIRGTSF